MTLRSRRPDARSRTRWLVGGAVVGAALAGLANARSRSGAVSTPVDGTASIITERDAAAFLVRRRVDPDRVELVRDHVVRTLASESPDALLGVDGASTASLFLDAGDDPELAWYVEVPRSAIADRSDPAAAVADAFPIDHEAVALGDDTRDGTVDRAMIVHAANPSRPRTARAADDRSAGGSAPGGGSAGGSATGGRSPDASGTHGGSTEGSFSTADGPVLVTAPFDDGVVDVELVRLELEPGLPERLADRFERLTRWLVARDRRLERIERWSAEMLDAERMYTESIFLERGPGGYALEGYMETAEMRGVYEAYYDTWNPVARVSEWLLERVLVDPDVLLSYPLETDVEPLAHAVDPDRPRRPAARSSTDRHRSD